MSKQTTIFYGLTKKRIGQLLGTKPNGGYLRVIEYLGEDPKLNGPNHMHLCEILSHKEGLTSTCGS